VTNAHDNNQEDSVS